MVTIATQRGLRTGTGADGGTCVAGETCTRRTSASVLFYCSSTLHHEYTQQPVLRGFTVLRAMQA